MQNSEEIFDFIGWFLRRLRDVGAPNVAIEIETAIRRGEVRAWNEVHIGRPDREMRERTYQTPLTADEALDVAVTLFLAAVETTFHIEEVSRATSGGYGDQRRKEVRLEHDRLEGEPHKGGMAFPLPIAEEREGLHLIPTVVDGELASLREECVRLREILVEFTRDGGRR